MDPIALWNPVMEIEHYIEGQHNVGIFNDGYYLVAFENIEECIENYYGVSIEDMDIVWSSGQALLPYD